MLCSHDDQSLVRGGFLFQLAQPHTRVTTECLAGVTTFFAMLYIAVVNPLILSAAGLDPQAVFIATCLTVALGCFLMGGYVKVPVVLAPAMGVNVYFTYHMVLGLGMTWQVALGMVLIAGLVLWGLSFTTVRQWLMEAIPIPLQVAIGVGIGMFIILIGLQNAGVMALSHFALVESISWYPIGCFFTGLLLILGLRRWRVPGALLWTILAISVISGWLGKTTFQGVWAWPSGLSATALQLEIGSWWHWEALFVMFALGMVMLFDTTGTLMSLMRQMHLPTPTGFYRKALRAEAATTCLGALLGTAPTAPYIESMAGMQSGGRGGLTAVVVGLLFLGVMFFAPLIQMIPPYAVAPVLVFIGTLMVKEIGQIPWRDGALAPAVLAIVVVMPLTFSIADGMGAGFIVYTVMSLLLKRRRQLHPMMWVLAGTFGLFFVVQSI